MSYRKIAVHGKTYEYVIGSSNIHIKGFGDFSVKIHGNVVSYPNTDSTPRDTKVRVATPATVRALILGKETPVKLENGQYRLMISPFDSEIYGKITYLPYDAESYYRSAAEI